MTKSNLPPDIENSYKSLFSRRDFMRLSTALGFLASCRPPYHPSDLMGGGLPSFDGQGKSVVILGGGPAGLCAAYELDQRGFAVTVLERTPRVSGRVWTQYDFFDDGQYCELGATRIPDCHFLTTGYAQKLGLELVALDHGPLDNTAYFTDETLRFKKSSSHGHPWPEDLVTVESSYAGRAFQTLDDPTRPGWPKKSGFIPRELRALDDLTLAGYLKSIGYSDFARKIVESANGSEVNMYSALAWLAGEYLARSWERTYRIKGGNQQLAEAFMAKLSPRSQVELMAEVVAVETLIPGSSTKLQNRGSPVRVTYKQKGSMINIESDFCISTLPLDVIGKVKWTPDLSPPKRRASAEVVMQPVTRINLQFKKRFWEHSPYVIRGLKVLHSDLSFERLWDMTGSEDQKWRRQNESPMGILTAYVQHEKARILGELDPKQRVDLVLDEMSRIFPEAKSHFHKGMSFVWHKQEWIGGGWSAYAPGQIELYLATQTREGAVYFAGDHTSLEPGWIQGALQSVHRVLNDLAVNHFMA